MSQEILEISVNVDEQFDVNFDIPIGIIGFLVVILQIFVGKV